MRILLAALAAVLSVSTVEANVRQQHDALSQKELETHFTKYIKKYNKKYEHDDFFKRFHIFQQNMEKIRQHNAKGKNYRLDVNEFADMTAAEFKATKLGYKHVDRSHYRKLNEATFQSSLSKNKLRGTAGSKLVGVPDSVDWREQNAVSEVKNQGQCGSCWSFSTTGSVEGAVAIATGTLTSLSEQQLIDCSTKQGNQGCNGGLMDDAFQYIISNGGITSEADYPYTAAEGTCNTSANSVSTITSFTDVPQTEDDLLSAVAVQPVSVAIEADQDAFQLYSGGVMDGTCGSNLDHGVLVVGYGTDSATNAPYWIVKNSWGPTWGEQGYIRIQRGSNLCGIANSASFPVA